MNPVLHYLTRIDQTSGRNDKITLLTNCITEYPNSTHLVFKVAMDPMVSTFITKFPEPAYEDLSHLSTPPCLTDLLHDLVNGRRYSKQEWSKISRTFHDLYSPDEMKMVKRILTKDLTIGASLSSFNKALSLAKSDLPPIKEYDTVRVSNIEDSDINPIGSYVSVKKDGANATFTSKGFISRNGNPIPLKHLEDALEGIKGEWVLFGELVSTDRQSSSGLVNSAIQKGYDSEAAVHTLQFHVFDIIHQYVYDNLYDHGMVPSHLFFRDRLLTLNEVVPSIGHEDIILVDHIPVNSIEEVYSLYDKFIQEGEEGIIWNDEKMIFSITRSTKRARIKEVIDADFRIIGFQAHSKNPDMLGSFIFETTDGLLTSNTGSGMTDEQRLYFWANKKELMGKTIKVYYNKVIPSSTEEGKFSLFLPVLNSKEIIRDDKPVADSLRDIDWGSANKAKKKFFNIPEEGK